MAFPTIVSTATSAADTFVNPASVTLPSGIQPGDLIVIVIRTHVGPLTSGDSIIPGFTHLTSRNWGGYSGAFSRIADGTEGSTTALDLGANAKSAHVSYLIRGHNNNILAEINNSNINDPPAITASWSGMDNLFLAALTNRPSNSTVSSGPSGYLDLVTSANASSSAGDSSRVSIAHALLSSISENAGPFTASGIQEPHSIIIAIEGGEATEPTAPTANFSSPAIIRYAPSEVSFTDTSTGIPESWSWDFGDGQTSTEQNPRHTYIEEGIYTVSLTVTNTLGSDTKTEMDYITIFSRPENSISNPSFEDSPPAYDEIDVHESSAWGNTRPQDFTGVQLMHNMWRPLPDNSARYVEDTWMDMPPQALQTHRLIWEPGKMTVDSFLGEGTTTTPIMHHEFLDVPVPKQTRIHYNLWVVGGGFEPENATPLDVTVKDFSYTPLGSESGKFKVWENGSWTGKPVKVYVDGQYIEKPLKRYNGSIWVTT